ncbi:MAG: hypothetical protein H6Q90_186 [Deltaproteobacteria bacterium]|nr:hypothetical protein [Deltaproteobacteria bacterium]
MSRTVSLSASLITMAISAAVFGGCLMPAQGPKGGVVASGQPLAVVDDVKVWTTTQKEKVGETEYKDSSGNVIGTGTSYQDKTTVHSMKVWYPVQGTEQLADEDFFKIAGDQKALDETLAMRANGKKWNHRGMYTMAGGVVGVIVGFIVPNPTAALVLRLGGGLAVSGGYYMSFWGARQMNPESHAVDRSVADRAANQYNQQLGQSAGVSMARKF